MGHLEVFFRATPWALPLTGLACVALIPFARPLGRQLEVRPSLAWLFAVAVAGFLAVTLSPSSDAGHWGQSQGLTGGLSLPSLASLLELSSESLNVWLGVPVGLLGGLVVAAGRRSTTVLVGVVALAPLAEGIQYAIPVLGRSAFFMADVAANWLGIAIGLLVGVPSGLTIRDHLGAQRTPSRNKRAPR